MRRIAVLTAAGLVLLVLVVAQLLLPGIAAQELRSNLEQSGTVLEVKVSAFPAIKLLWHKADTVVVRMGSYRSGGSHFGDTLGRASDANSLDASVEDLYVGPLTLRGNASFLGLHATVDATVSARDGALVVAPNTPLGGIAAITLFDNPHVQVTSVTATNVPGGFRVSANATVH